MCSVVEKVQEVEKEKGRSGSLAVTEGRRGKWLEGRGGGKETEKEIKCSVLQCNLSE